MTIKKANKILRKKLISIIKKIDTKKNYFPKWRCAEFYNKKFSLTIEG
jgi:hypothetical protein